MPYEITNADVAARAARDMRRLASTVIELTEEAAQAEEKPSEEEAPEKA